jgi:hypothetical protein
VVVVVVVVVVYKMWIYLQRFYDKKQIFVTTYFLK